MIKKAAIGAMLAIRLFSVSAADVDSMPGGYRNRRNEVTCHG